VGDVGRGPCPAVVAELSAAAPSTGSGLGPVGEAAAGWGGWRLVLVAPSSGSPHRAVDAVVTPASSVASPPWPPQAAATIAGSRHAATDARTPLLTALLTPLIS
jgi:hypothetical protein